MWLTCWVLSGYLICQQPVESRDRALEAARQTFTYNQQMSPTIFAMPEVFRVERER